MRRNGRKIFNPREAKPWTPKKAWVELTDGSSVCIWQLSVSQTLELAQVSQRHPQDPRPGMDPQEAAIWQIIFAVKDGDGPEAKPVYQPHEGPLILALNPDDFAAMMNGIAQVSGLTEEAANARRDFTPATPASSSPA